MVNKLKVIGIVVADPVELPKIKWRLLQTIQCGSFKVWVYKLKKLKIILAVSGVGMVQAAACTQQIIFKFKPEIILNFGAVGSSNLNSKIFDICVPGKIYNLDIKIPWLKAGQGAGQPIFFQNMKLVKNQVLNLGSSMNFYSSLAQAKNICKSFPVSLVDMEAVAIAQISHNNNTNFFTIKCVSDIIGNKINKTLLNERIKKAAQLAFNFLEKNVILCF